MNDDENDPLRLILPCECPHTEVPPPNHWDYCPARHRMVVRDFIADRLNQLTMDMIGRS